MVNMPETAFLGILEEGVKIGVFKRGGKGCFFKIWKFYY